MIYFDNAASTPVFDSVSEHMYLLQKEVFGNPSALHAFGRKARVEVERARALIAKKMNVQPAEIFFTSGGTEANNAILWGCAKDLNRKVFITSPTEHPCVLNTLESICKSLPVEVQFVDIDNMGQIDMSHLEFLLKNNKNAVVSLMHANNETGVLLPMNEVAPLCKENGALFHSDIVQTAGKYNLDFQSLGFDFAAVSAHKFHGPKGVGFMYVRSGSFFKPFITGGMQERKMRAGTENVVGISGMGKALYFALENMNDTIAYVSSIKERLLNLLKTEIPGAFVNGSPMEKSLYSLVNISLPKTYNSEMLLAKLDIEGIAVSTGSACNSGSGKGSHVLTAIGADPERPSVRVSFSRFNTIEEVDRFAEVLKGIGV
ncbi:MAG: cysteine desulfurase [Bacteroidetes bacterium]|nr:cysteine desulfurase [Bacteroidota bacterium]